jgi:Glycosyl transferase family 2
MLAVSCICLAVIAYVYVGYPALLRLGVFGARREWKRGIGKLPLVSIVVPAHNEEAVIEKKIKNLLASDYPRECIEILIGSDGSSDRTEEIVRAYASQGVGLVSFPQQHGKSAIQNSLVALASGEILVFTDADCTLAPNALRNLIDNFADPAIGLVTGRPVFENSFETTVTRNEGSYLNYETWLRMEESARGLLVLASGSLFAMRRALWKPLEAGLGDDFALPLRVARAGFRSVLESHSIAITQLTQKKPQSMFRMKVRIIAKDLRALLASCELLNPIRHGATTLSLCSHKLLRWLVPYFLLGLFAANAFLLANPLPRAFFASQIAFYALAVCGLLIRTKSVPRVLSIPMSFCIVNAAALVGTLSCVSGRTFGRWTPERAVGSRTLDSRGVRT